MIFNRIKVGAKRTSYLINNKLSDYKTKNVLNHKQLLQHSKQVAIAALVIRIIAFPIPTSAASQQAQLLGSEDSGPVPDMVRIDESVTSAIRFAPENINLLSVESGKLQNLALGKSNATEKEEAALALQKEQQAVIAAQKAQEAAVAKKQTTVTKTKSTVIPTVTMSYGEVQQVALRMTIAKFGESEWAAMHTLIMRESKYNPNAVNRSSGACGIPQALPCSKLTDKSVEGQIAWMLNYVSSRYGTPSKAVAFHNYNHWY